MAEPAPATACVFCAILAGRAPASRVYHDEVCTAFLDIRPINPGHLLVVPNAHVASLAELEPDTGAHLFRVAQRLAAAVRRSGVRCEGVNLLLADGAPAGQEVFHVHVHVVPRFTQDGFGSRISRGNTRLPDRAELDEIAHHIRAAVNPEVKS